MFYWRCASISDQWTRVLLAMRWIIILPLLKRRVAVTPYIGTISHNQPLTHHLLHVTSRLEPQVKQREWIYLDVFMPSSSGIDVLYGEPLIQCPFGPSTGSGSIMHNVMVCSLKVLEGVAHTQCPVDMWKSWLWSGRPFFPIGLRLTRAGAVRAMFSE